MYLVSYFSVLRFSSSIQSIGCELPDSPYRHRDTMSVSSLMFLLADSIDSTQSLSLDYVTGNAYCNKFYFRLPIAG